MEGDRPVIAEAIVEQGGRIAYVGPLAGAKARFPGAVPVDLEGRTLLPGFIDPHSHIGMVINTMGQLDLSSPPVGDTENFDDILRGLTAC